MKILRRVRALFRKNQLDSEMNDEMRLHLELQTERNRAAGMSAEDARFAAQRQFGNVASVQEQAREQRGFIWLEQMGQDLRFGARQLRRNPGFAVTAIATLALGIGATTAIFSVVNGVLLKPLPYAEPAQLVQVFETWGPGGHNPVSPGAMLDWREQGTLFEGFAAYTNVALNLTGTGEPERVNGVRMTANALQLLRARPVVGRLLAADEDQAGAPKVVVLAHSLWQRRFGGDPAIIGQSVQFNGESHTVVGILPPGFLAQSSQEFVIPFVFPKQWREQRAGHFLQVIGRLKPGVSLEQARAELAAIRQRTDALYPAWKKSWGNDVVPLQEHLASELKPAFLVLLVAVGCVLLIGCANIANLLLAKAVARGKEMAVRAALGASRGRMVRQLLSESLLLALAGGVLGLLVAVWGVDALRRTVIALNAPRAHEIVVDPVVLGFALGAAMLTGLGFGLVPAWQAARPQLRDALQGAPRGSTGTGDRKRHMLIVGEVALAFILLVGAGLTLISFSRVMRESPGFDPHQGVTMQLSLPEQKYRNNAQRADFYARLLERVAALPGVEAAGVGNALSLQGETPDQFFRIPGRSPQAEPGYAADYINCTPGFLEALGVPLRRGRTFARGDTNAALIGAAMERDHFVGEDPLGRQVGLDNQTWEIVGIVGDLRTRGITRPARPVVFRPISAAEAPRLGHLVVRSTASNASLVAAIREVLRDLDPALPIAAVRTLEDVVEGAVARGRLTFLLLAAFAGTALLLAAIGLYGVVAYTVTQRTREIGIRLALGASPRRVLRQVLGHGLKLVVLGLILGALGAAGLTRLLASLLYQVSPADTLVFGGMALLLLAVALAAAWLPARRAAKVDPMVALRAE